jgi:flagellar biogenesis protein FliO
MLTQLALLPLLAVTVTGVTSETHDSDVVIDVATSEPVAARVARPMTGTSLLYVFVDGATPDRAVFENGDHPIAARTRTRYTKLEIPLDPGVRCREPASVATLDSGLRVQFSCGSKAGAIATAEAPGRLPIDGRQTIKPAARAASQELLAAALALPAGTPFAGKTETEEDENQASKPLAETKPSVEATALPAQVAKATAPAAPAAASAPAETAKPLAQEAKAVAPAPAETAKPLAQEAKAVVPAPAPATPAAAPATPAAAPTNAASAPAPAHSSSAPVAAVAGASHSGASLVLAVVMLAAVAGGVLLLTRRRARRQGLIQILETAAIGPKRSLLVARVNGQTMVLGASEAGITLLTSLDARTEPQVAAVMGNLPAMKEQPENSGPEVTIDAPSDSEGEMGMLSRLFGRRPKDSSAQDAAAFRELLEESYEDQELRNKLAQGLSGKVS